MKFLQELFHGKGYIDGITIINLEGEILFTAKFNNKLGQDQGSEELVGKNFLDVYENLTPQTSTTIKAMERGTPAYVENQFLKTRGRDGITITSLSIPIKCGGGLWGPSTCPLRSRASARRPRRGCSRWTSPAIFTGIPGKWPCGTPPYSRWTTWLRRTRP